MADYTVLYHDPVRLNHDDSRTIFAAQSVWVCRDDRYAFEVHVLGQRGADDSDETLDQYGEGRYRFALALLGGQHAQSVALDDPPKADPIIVAVAATEVLALYDWWKTVRPIRPDPYDASGWSAICARRRSEDEDFLAGLEDRTDKERAESIAVLARCSEIEQQHEDEDTEMLTRLIRIRKSLWT